MQMHFLAVIMLHQHGKLKVLTSYFLTFDVISPVFACMYVCLFCLFVFVCGKCENKVYSRGILEFEI